MIETTEQTAVERVRRSFEEFRRAAEGALVLAKSAKVETSEEVETAGGVAAELRKIEKAIHTRRLEATKEARDFVAHVNDYAAQISRPIGEAKRLISEKLMKWQVEERRRQDEARREIQKAEAEALLSGQQPVQVTRQPETVKAIQTRKTLQIEVVNIADVPAQFLQIDEAKVKETIRAGRTVPGIRHFYAEVPVVRAAR